MTDHVVHRLEPEESVADHPCTSYSLYAPDMDLLAYLLQDLRTLLRAEHAGRAEVIAHHPKLWTVHGLRRRTVVCDPVEIRRRTLVCVVGFFAERRDSIDYERLDDLELDLMFEFRRFPGILSYSSMELADDYWANLVIHSVPDDTETWRTSPAHAHAVERSPHLYSSVRIHNGHLAGGVMGSEAIAVDRTKYWDYDHEPTWHAIREFDPPLARVRRQSE